ncbi:MAG: WD40 repeat domain-containing protein [Planctomycetes bacterium]|nr:WD40 repeat domain-containing protein [Planctomycetota bacterium]
MAPLKSSLCWVLLATVGFSLPPLLRADEAANEPKPLSVLCLEFSPDGGLLAAAASRKSRGELVVWEVDKWKPRFRHSEAVAFRRVAFSPDGRMLALSRLAPELKLLDVENGKLLRQLKGHTDHARCVAFTPDGKRIITGSLDRTIKIWSAAKGEVLATLSGHTGAVHHVDVSPNGSLLASVEARTGKVHMWDLNTLEALHVYEGSGWFVPHAAFSPNGRLLAVASWGGQLGLYDTKTYQLRTRIQDVGGVHWSEFSPDGQWLAVVSNGPTIYAFPTDTSADEKTKERVHTLLAEFKMDSYEAREKAAEALAKIGPAAESQLRDAMKSPNAEVRWRARQLRRRLSHPESAVQLKGHLDDPNCVCFSPDGKLMASGDRLGEIKVWRVDGWKQVVSLSIRAKPGP